MLQERMLKSAMFYCQRCGKKNETENMRCSYCETYQQFDVSEVEKKNCKQCGKKIPVNANYCSYCGLDQAQILLKELDETSQAKEKENDQQKDDQKNNEIPTIDISDPQKLKEFIKEAKKEGIKVHVLGKNESFKPGIVPSTKLFIKNWVNVNKRMGRADFWWGLLGTFLLSIPVGALISLIVSLFQGFLPGNVETISKLCMAAWLAFFYVALLTAMIRRLHDIELPAYLALLLFIPGGDLISFIIATLPQRRTKSTYTFEDPKKSNKNNDHRNGK